MAEQLKQFVPKNASLQTKIDETELSRLMCDGDVDEHDMSFYYCDEVEEYDKT